MSIDFRRLANPLLFLLMLTLAGNARAAVDFSVDVNPGSAAPGEQVSVDIRVTNTGSGDLSGLIVTLDYPSGIDTIAESGGLLTGPVNTTASCIGGGSNAICQAGETLQWDLSTLTPGQAVALSLSPTVASGTADGTPIPWEIRVSDGGGDLAAKSVTLTVDSAPVLALTIDADQDPVPGGGLLTYRLRYGNQSASSVTGTVLRFALPTGVSFVAATGGGSLSSLSGGEVSWDLATLPAGAVAEQSLDVQVVGGLAPGTLLQSEALIEGVSQALPTARGVTDTVYVGTNTSLALALRVAPLPAMPNQQATVELLVSNPSSSNVFGGVVRLRYPSRVNAIGESSGLVTGPVNTAVSCIGGGSNTICQAGESLQWDLGILTPGQAVVLSLSPTVALGVSGGAMIPWDASVSDDSGALTMESAALAVEGSPALTLAIDASQDPVPAGDRLTYRLRYGNRSASSVAATALRFALPAGTSLVSATGGASLSGGVVSWDLATLPAGAVAQQTVELQVAGGLANGTLLEPEAVIEGVSGALPTVRRAMATGYVGSNPRLVVTMSVAPLPAQPGQQVTVDLEATNPTSSNVFGGTVLLRYPPGVNSIGEAGGLVTGPVNGAVSCTGGGSNTICQSGEILQWDLGTLAPGQMVPLSLSPTVASTTLDGDLIQWSATASEDLGSLQRDSVVLPIGIPFLDEQCSPISFVIPVGILHGTQVFRSELELSTSAGTRVAADGNVTFEASERIQLNSGFGVDLGGQLSARIAPVSCWIVQAAE